jgi:SAM-dependent methyltransferase
MEQRGWSEDITALHALEGDDHCITVASRETAVEALRRYAKPDGSFLEIGSCFGHTLVDMIAAFPDAKVTGSDTLPSMLAHLRQRVNVPIIELDILNSGIADASFDAVVALNVLEHIEDHGAAVREIARILKPGGVFVCEVPAGPSLYDGFDAFLLHFRRYGRSELRALATDAGLAVVDQSAIGFVVYPGFWAAKRLNRLRYGTAPSEALTRKAIRSNDNPVVTAAFALEKRLRGTMSFPAGIRHTIVAAKPAT